MIFSHTTHYAVRAMTFLAAQPAGKLTGAREISAAEEIPIPFLWKILQRLARAKLVRSFKGAQGGYELAREAGQITLQAIVEAVDDNHFADRCVLGLAECNGEKPCTLHEQWKVIRGQLMTMLEQTTAADLARVHAQNNGARPNSDTGDPLSILSAAKLANKEAR